MTVRAQYIPFRTAMFQPYAEGDHPPLPAATHLHLFKREGSATLLVIDANGDVREANIEDVMSAAVEVAVSMGGLR